MEAGKLVPLHSHTDPECFYLFEGQIDVFVVDDAPKWRMVETGQSYLDIPCERANLLCAHPPKVRIVPICCGA
jgi:hypothetical protein